MMGVISQRKKRKYRGASLQKLPLNFDAAGMVKLEPLWDDYYKELKPSISLPSSFGNVVSQINHWLKSATTLCNPKNH